MSIIFDNVNNELIRQVMLEHYQNPIYKKNILNNGEYCILHSKNYNCIDDIYIFLKIERDLIKECFWNGKACVITSSSTDIMCGLVINKNKCEACMIIEEYFKMIEEKQFNKKVLQEAIVFINVSKQLARIKCARIGFDTLYRKIKNINK